MKEKSKTKTERTNELQWRTRILMGHRNATGNPNKQTNKQKILFCPYVQCWTGSDQNKEKNESLSIELKKLIPVGLF